MPPPPGEDGLGVAAGVEDGEQPDFRRADDVEKPVGETVEIGAAHVGKAYGVELRVARQAAVVGEKVRRKLHPQTGPLVFIPVDGLAEVSTKERMSSQHAHP